jgi:hypothetical protein
MRYPSTTPPYSIGINGPENNTYLPGGDWNNNGGRIPSMNHLPKACDSFVFLEVKADLSQVNGQSAYTVFVPCYFCSDCQ